MSDLLLTEAATAAAMWSPPNNGLGPPNFKDAVIYLRTTLLVCKQGQYI